MNTESKQGVKQERTPYANNIWTMGDLSVEKRPVLLRSDLDFGPDEEKTSGRFSAVKPTVKELERRGAQKITILAHNGKKLSLEYLKRPLEDLLQEDVAFIKDSSGNTEGRRVVLFENTRLNSGEEINDPNYVAYLSKMGDIYVGNAFATSHRKHASMVGIPTYLREKAAGLQVEAEVNNLDKVLSCPKEGFVLVIGGAKIETKLPIIAYMADKVETILIGGKNVKEIEELKRKGTVFPDNIVVGELDKARGDKDITLKSAENFAKILSEAKTVVWNGAMGVFEEKETAQGTLIIINGMAQARSNGAFVLAGGGETEDFLKKNNLEKNFDHISVGGGAMLEYIGGKKMAGLEVLRK